MGTPGDAGIDGGARRDRTADLLHAMQALSQLSYSPTRGCGLYARLPGPVKKTAHYAALRSCSRIDVFERPLQARDDTIATDDFERNVDRWRHGPAGDRNA